ncbi:MAG: GNAT family N-acetyltransferase [Rubrivivax sp.]
MVSSDITANVRRGPVGLEALRASWEDLLARQPRRRFFHEWGWYEAWLRELAPRPQDVLFVELRRDARALAIVPLVPGTQRRAGLRLRELRLPEHDHLPLADIVCEAGLDAAQLLPALKRALARERIRWDLLRFSMVLAESPLARGLEGARLPRRVEPMKVCEQVDCGLPWEQFAARLSGNFRSNLNRARSRLARESDVRWQVAATPAEIDASFAAFLEVEASGWKGREGTAIACRPELVRFYQRLIGHFAPADRLRINLLSVGGRTIAAQFCPLDADTLYVYKLGYDEEYSRLAPGNALIEQMVRVGGEQRRYRYINLVGNPPWFASWRPEGTPVHLVILYARTLPAFAVRLLGAVRRWRRAQSRAPDPAPSPSPAPAAAAEST